MKNIKLASFNAEAPSRIAGNWSQWAEFFTSFRSAGSSPASSVEQLRQEVEVPLERTAPRLPMKSLGEDGATWQEWRDFLKGRVSHESNSSD